MRKLCGNSPKLSVFNPKLVIVFILVLISINYLYIIIGNKFGIYGSHNELVRNWAFYGMPCFLAGMLIKHYFDNLAKTSNWILLLMFILGITILCIYKYLNINFSTDFSISIFLISFSLFIYSFKIKKSLPENISQYCDKVSMYVYITHWEIMIVVQKIIYFVGISEYKEYISFPITLCLTVIFSTILYLYLDVRKSSTDKD